MKVIVLVLVSGRQLQYFVVFVAAVSLCCPLAGWVLATISAISYQLGHSTNTHTHRTEYKDSHQPHTEIQALAFLHTTPSCTPHITHNRHTSHRLSSNQRINNRLSAEQLQRKGAASPQLPASTALAAVTAHQATARLFTRFSAARPLNSPQPALSVSLGGAPLDRVSCPCGLDCVPVHFVSALLCSGSTVARGARAMFYHWRLHVDS